MKKIFFILTLVFGLVLTFPSADSQTIQPADKQFVFSVDDILTSPNPLLRKEGTVVIADILKDKRLYLGDSTLVVKTGGYSPVWIETNDSNNSSTDTFKVYIGNQHGDWQLAWLKLVNDTTTYNGVYYKPTYVPGLVISGNNTSTFYEVVAQYPFQIMIVRTNVATLTRYSYVAIRGIKKVGMNDLKKTYNAGGLGFITPGSRATIRKL